MDSLLRDLRYGFRLLLKNPGTTLSAVLTLALGIGATSAIFTFVNAALLRGLPFPRPEQLLDITMTQKGSNFASTYLNFLDWQQQAKSFSAMGAYNRGPAILYSGNTPERVVTLNVSGGFFSTLQVRAAEGRLLQDSDQLTSPPAVAVVTHAFGELHRNIASVGDSLKIGNTSYQIVGVLPREFQFPSAGQIDVIIPLNPKAVNFSRRDFHNVNVVARLRSGVVMDQAQSEMSTIAARQAQQYPDTNAGLGVRLQSLHQSVVGSTQQLLLLLLGAVSLVLLIACANVANVMLAKAAGRERELMVRAALGASAGRIVRQLLTESMLLAVVAGAAGATIAAWGVTALLKLIPPALRAQLPYSNSLSVDLRTLLFTAALALATGILFGVAPALRARVAALHSALAEDSRTAAGSRNSLRAGLVVGEVAIAVTLLIGSGLLLETLWRVAHADAGFNSHNLLVGNFAAPFSKYNANDKALQLDQQLQGRLSEIPGVAGAALTTDIPLNGANSWLYFQVQGAPVLPIGQQPLAVVHNATPSYLSTLQVPLLAGRMFTDQDDYSAKVQVAVVNQKMASQYLGGKPLGKILRFTSLPNIPPMEVVGVVADVKESFLDRPDVPAIYLPAAQSPMAAGALVLRTQGDPNNFVPAVREALASVDRDIAVYNTSSMDERIAGSNSMFLRRMPALLLGVFASLALLLSSIGIYGVISYGVVRRTREFGVRMALGATSGAVVRLVLRSGARLTLLGILIGLVTGCVAAQLASSLLFGVKPFDLTVLAATAAAVALVSLTAAFLPAMRAARLQPLSALRHE